MGLSVEDEVRCPKSGYSIDMLVREKEGVGHVSGGAPSAQGSGGAAMSDAEGGVGGCGRWSLTALDTFLCVGRRRELL